MPVMTTLFRPTGRAISRRSLGVALGMALLLGSTLSGGAAGIGTTRPDAALDSSSVQYHDAMAHAADPNKFTPGDAVSVPTRRAPGSERHRRIAARLPYGRQCHRSGHGGELAGFGLGRGRDRPAGQRFEQQVAPDPKLAANGAGLAGPATAANVLRREVYGFLPYWNLGDYNQLRRHVDGRLLWRRPQRRRQPRQAGGWLDYHRLGGLDSSDHDGRHQCRSRRPCSSRAHRQELRLGQRCGRSPDIAPLQRGESPQCRGADRGGRPRPRRRRSEPRLRAGHNGSVGQLRDLRSPARAALDAVHAGYELTFCATGHMGNYDAAKLAGRGRGPTTSSSWATTSATAARRMRLPTIPHQPTGLRPDRRRDLVQGRHGRPRRSSWACPTTALPTQPRTPDRNSANQSGTTYGDAVWVPYYTAASLAATNLKQYDPSSSRRGFSYYGSFGGAPTWRELLLRRCPGTGAPGTTRINYWNLGGVGILDSRLRHRSSRVEPSFWRQVPDRSQSPTAGIVNIAPSQANETFTVTWTGRTTGAASSTTTSRSPRTRHLDRLVDPHDGHHLLVRREQPP